MDREILHQWNQKIDLSQVLQNFTERYPNHPLTPIILREPNQMTDEEFLGKVGTWLAICDIESNKNEKEQVRWGGF